LRIAIILMTTVMARTRHLCLKLVLIRPSLPLHRYGPGLLD
jgi:hypothetical protein